MAYNKNSNDGCATVVAFAFYAFIIYAVADKFRDSISTNILHTKLPSFVYYVLFFIAVLLIIAAIGGMIYAINVLRRMVEAHRFKTKKCTHGVQGGETLGLCVACKREKEERERQWKLEYEAKNRKKILQEEARKLLRTEIEKFEGFNLKKQEYLLSLSSREFEDVIAKLFRKLGYKVKQTPYSNDGGRDAVATKDGITYSIECKRYGVDRSIGREPLQKFFAAMHADKAKKGFFISTCRFTKTAINYAKDNNIELVDLNKLLSLMREGFPEDHESESLCVMCTECGSIVNFSISSFRRRANCQNGVCVRNVKAITQTEG